MATEQQSQPLSAEPSEKQGPERKGISTAPRGNSFKEFLREQMRDPEFAAAYREVSAEIDQEFAAIKKAQRCVHCGKAIAKVESKLIADAWTHTETGLVTCRSTRHDGIFRATPAATGSDSGGEREAPTDHDGSFAWGTQVVINGELYWLNKCAPCASTKEPTYHVIKGEPQPSLSEMMGDEDTTPPLPPAETEEPQVDVKISKHTGGAYADTRQVIESELARIKKPDTPPVPENAGGELLPCPPHSPCGQAWHEWFERVGDHATAEVVNATANLVSTEREIHTRSSSPTATPQDAEQEAREDDDLELCAHGAVAGSNEWLLCGPVALCLEDADLQAALKHAKTLSAETETVFTDGQGTWYGARLDNHPTTKAFELCATCKQIDAHEDECPEGYHPLSDYDADRFAAALRSRGDLVPVEQDALQQALQKWAKDICPVCNHFYTFRFDGVCAVRVPSDQTVTGWKQCEHRCYSVSDPDAQAEAIINATLAPHESGYKNLRAAICSALQQARSGDKFASGVEASIEKVREIRDGWLPYASSNDNEDLAHARGLVDAASEIITALRALVSTESSRFKGAIYKSDGPTHTRLEEIRKNAADGYEEFSKKSLTGPVGAFTQMLNDLHFVLSMVPDPTTESSGPSDSDKARPRIICLCGSTRFIELFAIKTWELEREGYIVLGCTLLPMWYCNTPSHFGEATGTKEQCDELHKRKIDLADEVFVLNVDGYIGESTRSEIEYATALSKPIRYLEGEQMTATGERNQDEL